MDVIGTVASYVAPLAAGYALKWIQGYWAGQDYMRLGIQALLRDRMLQKWDYCRSKGYAPRADKGAFEAMHKSYAGLGANGVMNKIYHDFMLLPESKNDPADSHDR